MIQSSLPEELRIGLTNKCNLNCKHCYIHNREDAGKNIKLEEYLSLLENMGGHLKRVSITGGEPLVLKDDVFSICEKCKEMRVGVRLVTNGTLLTNSVIRTLKNCGVDLIQIGFDSIHSGFHDFIREKGTQEKVLQAIKKCVAAGIKVSIRYTLSKSNLKELIPTYEYLSKLRVYNFKLRMLFPVGSAKKSLKNEFISGEEWAQAQFEIIEKSINGIKVEITQPCLFDIPIESNAYKEICPCGLKAAYVDWNGDVKYCLFDEYNIGNIRERPFLEIWESPLMQRERKKRFNGQMNYECSSFAILQDQYGDYNKFIKGYVTAYKKLGELL